MTLTRRTPNFRPDRPKSRGRIDRSHDPEHDPQALPRASVNHVERLILAQHRRAVGIACTELDPLAAAEQYRDLADTLALIGGCIVPPTNIRL